MDEIVLVGMEDFVVVEEGKIYITILEATVNLAHSLLGEVRAKARLDDRPFRQLGMVMGVLSHFVNEVIPPLNDADLEQEYSEGFAEGRKAHQRLAGMFERS